MRSHFLQVDLDKGKFALLLTLHCKCYKVQHVGVCIHEWDGIFVFVFCWLAASHNAFLFFCFFLCYIVLSCFYIVLVVIGPAILVHCNMLQCTNV